MNDILAVTCSGGGGDSSSNSPPLVLLHGLFGSSRHWHHIASRLTDRGAVLNVDLRNHGASPHTPCMDYVSMASDVRTLLDARGVHRVTLVGHSMGGKVAMAFALLWPERVQQLVVVDIAPVRYPDGFSPLISAALRLDLTAIEARADADRMLATKVPSPRVRALLLQNLVRRDGRWAWRIHWAGIAASVDDLLDFPPALGARHMHVPALFVRGAESDYVLPRHRPIIDSMFPKASEQVIAGAGHWVHVDRPTELVQVIRTWLAGHIEVTAATVARTEQTR